MHKLLARQIKRCYGKDYETDDLTPDLRRLFDTISASYNDFQEDIRFISHTMAVSSQELTEANQKIVRNNALLEQKIAEKTKELNEQKQVFEAIYQKSSDGMLLIENSNYIDCNEAVITMLGAKSKDEVINVHPAKLSPALQYDGRSSFEKAEETIDLCLKHGRHYFEWIHKRFDGKIFWVDVALTKIRFKEKTRVLVVWRDITERKQLEEKIQKQNLELHRQARHDVLTGLPNRLLMLDRLDQAIKKADRNKTSMAVLFIDLDHFKKINDSLGHETGDLVLKQVAERLSGCIRESDTLARLGGDEFTVILEAFNRPVDVISVAEKLVSMLQKSFKIQGHQLYVTSSIGISIFPQDGKDSKTLLRNADTAMYKAKEKGKNTYQFYTEDMTEQAFERVLLEASLRRAIRNGEFLLNYQPQYNLHDNRLVGMEALIRWQHPEMGVIPPSKFIPLAEENGLIIPIGAWIFTAVMSQVSRWHEMGLEPAKVAINLAGKQILKDDLLRVIEETLAATGCKPEWITVEVTEAFIMSQPEESIDFLKSLSDIGIEAAIDDFGTGYSSLTYLKRLPVSTLKLDQSFVWDLAVDAESQAIAKAVMALARGLNLKVSAEGVETEQQKQFLLQEGCDQIQGFLTGKPLEVDAMTALLASLKTGSKNLV